MTQLEEVRAAQIRVVYNRANHGSAQSQALVARAWAIHHTHGMATVLVQECTAGNHRYAYTGSIPCTGARRCAWCGQEDPKPYRLPMITIPIPYDHYQCWPYEPHWSRQCR